MTIHLGRYPGHITLTSTVTDQMLACSVAEFVALLRAAKAGELDYILTSAGRPGPVPPAGTPPRADEPGPGWRFADAPTPPENAAALATIRDVDPAALPRLVHPAPITDPALREDDPS
jgi:hypothetical protein